MAPDLDSIADLLKQLGRIPARRVRIKPALGHATERDVIAVERREGRLCELVDGTLVEKVLSFPDSCLAAELIGELGTFVEQHDLGLVAGEGGMTRLRPGLVRIPDVSFYSWQQLGKKEIPTDPINRLAPDLAVEVISPGNTRQEIERKLKEYFLSGSRLVWIIDPRKRQAQVHTTPDESVTLTEADALDGGDVLPGFALPLRTLFALLPPAKKAARPKGKGRKSGQGGA